MTDEELIARLRERPFRLGFESEERPRSAADLIEALVKERAGLLTTWAESRERHLSSEARAERLEAAASSVADDVCSYICPSVGRAGEPILHDPRCIALRAALKGEDHE